MHIILKLAPLTLAMITTSAAQADFTSKKAMTAAHIPQKIQRLIHKEASALAMIGDEDDGGGDEGG